MPKGLLMVMIACTGRCRWIFRFACGALDKKKKQDLVDRQHGLNLVRIADTNYGGNLKNTSPSGTNGIGTRQSIPLSINSRYR